MRRNQRQTRRSAPGQSLDHVECTLEAGVHHGLGHFTLRGRSVVADFEHHELVRVKGHSPRRSGEAETHKFLARCLARA